MKGKKWKKFKPLFHSTLFQSHYLPPNCDDGFARNPRETKKAKVGPTKANCVEKTSQVHLITVAVLDKQFLFECIIMQKLNIYLSSLRKWKETNYVKLCFDNNWWKSQNDLRGHSAKPFTFRNKDKPNKIAIWASILTSREGFWFLLVLQTLKALN